MPAQSNPAKLSSDQPTPRLRPDYTAAIRYFDGRRDLFHVRNADNLADARALVLSEVGEVRSLLLALRH